MLDLISQTRDQTGTLCIGRWSFIHWTTRERLPWWLSGKESTCNAGDAGSIPQSGRSPGGGDGNPLQYSCLENPLDRGAYSATVHGVTESWTWLKWQHTPPSPRSKLSDSAQFSSADTLQPHGLQHARPPCPSLAPGVYPDSCPLNWWCHLTISSSFVPFSSCPQFLPGSGSFPMSHFSHEVAKVLEFQL